MPAFAAVAALTAPLFLLVFVGYALSRWGRWPKVASDALSRFVFAVAIPAFLFRLMSDFPGQPPVDAMLLVAYFGGALVTFALARAVAAWGFGMDGVGQSIFGVGTVFSNTVLLGIPLAKVTLGDAVLPPMSLVIVFNALVLWTLVTVSVEWARNRELSARGLAKTAAGVVTNPVVAAILLGTAFGYTGLALPGFAAETLGLMSQAAVPLSLIVLGMGLAEYGIRDGWRPAAALAVVKLAVFPLVVFVAARALALPERELSAVVMLAALPVGANVYLMAREFAALEGPVAASLVLTTLAAAVTTPVLLSLLR
ncbi:MAG: AEC family transporter [Betaproteobacteria bacterium]|nr:AEC family transporter [Betaproteobacteria bacterium]MCC7217296.1 AEC family transporter [Burkholderiales bacterium]